MTPLMVIGYVIYLVLETLAYLEAQTPSPYFHFESVNIGLNITLQCFHKNTDGMIFYWYKQTLGQKPQLISEFYRYKRNGSLKGEFWNDTRFDLETGEDKNHLKISNVQMSDSATYYCAGIDSYVYTFLEGFMVHVIESDQNIWTLVHQSRSETIQLGGSVTLSCTVQTGTCNGKHSIFWFRTSEEYLPEIIYTHGASDDQCKKKPTTQTDSCVYSLTIESLNASNAGTYHCAVASCGHILFGKGMKLDYEKNSDSSVLLYVLSGTLAFSTILVVILANKLYKTKSCKDPPERSSAATTLNRDTMWKTADNQKLLALHLLQRYMERDRDLGDEDADNLHYAALSHGRVSRSRGQRDTTSEIVYSSVRPQN